MQNFCVGDRIKVRWDETGNFFFAKILIKEDADDLQTYDVLYEELVRGKQCIEKNVTSNRICPASPFLVVSAAKELSSHFEKFQEVGLILKDTSITEYSAVNSSTISKALGCLLSEIGSLPDTWTLSENFEEVQYLFDELTKHIGKPKERLPQNELELIVHILNHSICLDTDFNFLTHFTSEPTSSKSVTSTPSNDVTHPWLTRGKGKQLLQSSRLTLTASFLLLLLVDEHETVTTINHLPEVSTTSTTDIISSLNSQTLPAKPSESATIATSSNNSTTTSMSTLVSEEILERILVNCKQFIKSFSTTLQPVVTDTNPPNTTTTGTTSLTPLSPPSIKSTISKRNKPIKSNIDTKGGVEGTTSTTTIESKKYQSSAVKKIMLIIFKDLLPMITSVLSAMLSTFLSHTQSHRLCLSAQELCFMILQLTDGGLPSYYDFLIADTKTLVLLQSAQRAALSLLEILCRHYQGLRPGILREFLPLLQSVYCSKCAMKSFQLNGYNRPNFILFRGESSTTSTISTTLGTGSASRLKGGSDKKVKSSLEGNLENEGNITVALGALLTAMQAMIFDSKYKTESHVRTNDNGNIDRTKEPTEVPIVSTTTTESVTTTDSSTGSSRTGNKKYNKLPQPTEKRTSKRGRGTKSESDSIPSTSTTSNNNSSICNQDTPTSTPISNSEMSLSMMVSSNGLKDINGYCSLFIYELLQRCNHKDTGSEYRVVTLALVKELVKASHHPAWPMAPFLLNRFILKIVSDVTANVGGVAITKDISRGSSGASVENKRDVSSLTCFYLELLGTLGSELLPTITTTKIEKMVESPIDIQVEAKGIVVEVLDSNVAMAVCGKLLKQLPLWNNIVPSLFNDTDISKKYTDNIVITRNNNEVLPVSESPSSESKKKRRKKEPLKDAATTNTNTTAVASYNTSNNGTSNKSLSTTISPTISLQQLPLLQIKSLVDISADIMSMAIDAMDTIGTIDTVCDEGSGSGQDANGLPTDTTSGCRRVSGHVPGPDAILTQCIDILTQADAVNLYPPLATRSSSVMELRVLLRYMQCLPRNTLNYHFWLTYVQSLLKYEGGGGSGAGGGELVQDMEYLALHLWLRDCETIAATNKNSTSNKVDIIDNNIQAMQMFVSKQITNIISRSNSIKSQTVTTTSVNTSIFSESLYVDSQLSDDNWHTISSLEWTFSQYSKILVDRFFHPGFERILQSVLLLLSDPTPAIRCKVIKTLAVLMKADARLVRRTAIRNAVVERFDDLAISVREEAVKLVGSFILSSYDSYNRDKDSDAIATSNAYLDGLVVRLRDRGVSVRKSVVTIIRDILLFQPDHPRYTELCVELLSRGWLPKEEDSIKDVIRTTFEQLWFIAPPVLAPPVVLPSPPIPLASTAITPLDSNNNFADKNNSTTTTTSSTIELPEGWVKRTIEKMENNNGGSNNDNSTILEVMYVSPNGLRVYSVQEAWETVRANTYQEGGDSTGSILHANSNDRIAETKEDINVPVPAIIPQEIVQTLPVTTQKYQHQYLVTVQQLLSVLRRSPNADWMVAMLRGVLHSPPEGVEEKKQAKLRRQEARQQCELLVDVLIELMLRGEEVGSEKGGGTSSVTGTGKGVTMEVALMDRGERLVSVIGTIAIFCEAHPPFVCKHLSTLLPYLKGDNALSMSQEAAVCLHVTNMLLAATAIEGFSLNDRVNEITSDLCQITLKFGTANVHASVHCLAMISSRLTRDVTPLVNLGKKCLSSMVEIAKAVNIEVNKTVVGRSKEKGVGSVVGGEVGYDNQFMKKQYITSSQSARIQRCLIVLGAVCEYLKKCSDLLPQADAEHDQQQQQEDQKQYDFPTTTSTTSQCQLKTLETPLQDIIVRDLPPSMLPYGGLVAVRYALELAEVVQVRAVQAMCAIFVFGPRMLLLPDISKLLTELLEGDKYSYLVHWKLLQSLKDMLMAEEIRLEKGAAECLMQDCGIAVGKRVLGPSETDSDATVAGSVLQSRLPSLLFYLSHKTSADIRYAALSLIGTLLRQGMICPLDVLAELVALQVDPEESIRKDSLLLLQIEDEKHPTFLDNRILEGIDKGVYHQCNVAGQAVPVVDVIPDNEELSGSGGLVKRSMYSPLYITCIQPNRRRRLDFLLSLIRRCDNCFLVIRKGGAGTSDVRISGNSTMMATGTPFSPSKLQRTIITTSTTTPTKTKLLPTVATKSGAKKSLKEALHLLDVCSYLCSTLAYLPYDVMEEPLHIVHWIGRNVTLTGAQLLNDMRLPLEQFGAVKRVEGAMQGPAAGSMPRKAASTMTSSKKGETVTGPSNSTTSAIATSSYSKGWEEGLILQETLLKDKISALAVSVSGNRHTMKEGSSGSKESLLLTSTTSITSATATTATPSNNDVNPPPVDMPLSLLTVETLLVMSAECRVKEALLRLKGFLKCAYNLSDERCLHYNPDDKPPGNDRADFIDHHRITYSPLPLDIKPLNMTLLPSSLNSNSNSSITSSKAIDPIELTSTVRQIVTDYNRLLVLLEGDPDDFSVSQHHPKKRRGGKVVVGVAEGSSSTTEALSTCDISVTSTTTTETGKRTRKGKTASSSKKKLLSSDGKKVKRKKKRIGFSKTTSDSEGDDDDDGDEEEEEFDPLVD